ncbi:hypothetical protein [Moraxella lacunata]|uniref:hypothetical protein n=1 Tax=Moraxella lacunata TaxID=477 RepID=UPI003EE2A73C
MCESHAQSATDRQGRGRACAGDGDAWDLILVFGINIFIETHHDNHAICYRLARPNRPQT